MFKVGDHVRKVTVGVPPKGTLGTVVERLSERRYLVQFAGFFRPWVVKDTSLTADNRFEI